MEGRLDVGRGEVSPRPTPAQLFSRHVRPRPRPRFSWRLQRLWEQQAKLLSQGAATLREQAPWALPELFTWRELTETRLA